MELKMFLYHVINDIFKQQDEAVVCHPDNFVYEFSTQERLSLAHTETWSVWSVLVTLSEDNIPTFSSDWLIYILIGAHSGHMRGGGMKGWETRST